MSRGAQRWRGVRADLGEQPARLARRRHGELALQAVLEAQVLGHCGGAVAGYHQRAHEAAGGVLGQPVSPDELARPAHALRGRPGLVGEARETLRHALGVRVAGGDRPVAVDAGERLAVLERRVMQVHPHVDQADPLAIDRQMPGRPAERAAQLVQGRAQARAGARLGHVGPQPLGELEARVGARVQREPGQQLARRAARGRVERSVVGLERHAAQEPHTQHGRTLTHG